MSHQLGGSGYGREMWANVIRELTNFKAVNIGRVDSPMSSR